MMPKIQYTFGLDFGTSKTAICLAPTGVINPTIDELTIRNREDRIASCVLRNAATNRVYVGRIAEQEYLRVQDPKQRAAMTFFSNFKPHIHQSKEQRQIALEFLTAVRRAERIAEPFERTAGEAVVAAGCPVSWLANGSAETLRLLLKQAGFPPAFAIPEPVGAAFHFLGMHHLKAQDFHRDIVVFDWGAGTFDMTVLRAGHIDLAGSRSWGSTLYGGRLFDDLFYQWLLEMAQKRGRHKELRKLAGRPTDRAILLGLTCRQIKEDYSDHYSNELGAGSWTTSSSIELGVLDDKISLGDFHVENAAAFEARMRSYTASEEARRWVDMLAGDVQPQEREFVDKLKRGEPIDLKAWGVRLIEAGMAALDVGEGATAVLTGGSCNWRWFLEHVRSIPPFAGRATSVLRDNRPELTIARGLARAYAIGSYSKRLSTEIKRKRDSLIPKIQSVHRELLHTLSLELTSFFRFDEELKADLRQIFNDGLNRVARRPTDGLREHSERLINIALRDPLAQAIRPDVEKRIERWLAENRKRVDRWAERFSIEAHQRVMRLLKGEINAEIGGLVEVAIEACSATGHTPFAEALRELGGAVRFESSAFSRVLGEILSSLPPFLQRFGTSLRGLLGMGPAEDPAQAFVTRFLEAMPYAIRDNILRTEPPRVWAARVVDHLIETLETLVRVARIDQAEQLVLEVA